MSATCYNDLIRHHGHLLVISVYGASGSVNSGQNAAIECYDCNEVLLDFDRYSEDPDEERILPQTKNKKL